MSIHEQVKDIKKHEQEEEWQRARLIAWSNLAPNAKRGKMQKPSDLFPLNIDKKGTARPKVFSRITKR